MNRHHAGGDAAEDHAGDVDPEDHGRVVRTLTWICRRT
jgi:hypothetical protein